MSDNRALASTESHFVFIEDDLLLRQLLANALIKRFAPRSFHSFSDAPAGLAHCLANPPDLLITDLRLPAFDGREIIRKLRIMGAPTRFLVLTSNVSAELPSELISLGVAGFIDKNSPLEHAERAIERVLAGGLYFSSGVRPVAMPYLPAKAATPPVSVLNEREREIARLVAGGMISKQIGDKLGLSARTIEKDRTQIMKKLGVSDLPGLVRWCVRHGLG